MDAERAVIDGDVHTDVEASVEAVEGESLVNKHVQSSKCHMTEDKPEEGLSANDIRADSVEQSGEGSEPPKRRKGRLLDLYHWAAEIRQNKSKEPVKYSLNERFGKFLKKDKEGGTS